MGTDRFICFDKRLRESLVFIFFLMLLQVFIAFPYADRMYHKEALPLEVLLANGKLFVRCLMLSAFIALPCLWLKGRLVRWIYTSAMSLIAVGMYFVESYLWRTHSALYSYGILQAVAGTNPQETQEYFQTFPWVVMLMPFLFFCIIILLTYLLTYFIS